MTLSTYFFYQFHVKNEPFPVFTRSQDWFDIKLLKTGDDPLKEWSYNSHKDVMKNFLKACKIRSSKVTHIARGAGTRMADLDGVDETQIRRLGRWNNTTMNGDYLIGLPREAMRVMAVFPKESGHF